jgi:hypothetical protein
VIGRLSFCPMTAAKRGLRKLAIHINEKAAFADLSRPLAGNTCSRMGAGRRHECRRGTHECVRHVGIG